MDLDNIHIDSTAQHGLNGKKDDKYSYDFSILAGDHLWLKRIVNLCETSFFMDHYKMSCDRC